MLEILKRADKSGKPLKIHAEVVLGEDGEPVLGPDGKALTVERPEWPVSSIELVGDAPKEHTFATKFVLRSVEDGFLEFQDHGQIIVLHLDTGDLEYKVVRTPGRYDDGDEVEVLDGYHCKLKGGK